jgi:predicted nucleic acid-binding protein
LPGLILSLDRGERDTLDMARKFSAIRVVIDERIGRDIAELLRLPVVGTLGVLLKAKALGLIPSFTLATQQMRQNGIYFHERLLAQLQERAGEGR